MRTYSSISYWSTHLITLKNGIYRWVEKFTKKTVGFKYKGYHLGRMGIIFGQKGSGAKGPVNERPREPKWEEACNDEVGDLPLSAFAAVPGAEWASSPSDAASGSIRSSDTVTSFFLIPSNIGLSLEGGRPRPRLPATGAAGVIGVAALTAGLAAAAAAFRAEAAAQKSIDNAGEAADGRDRIGCWMTRNGGEWVKDKIHKRTRVRGFQTPIPISPYWLHH